MRVILIEDVYDLGRRGKVVDVAKGYGRNFLIPRKLAVPATPGNLRMVEEQRVALAKKEAKDVEAAELLAQEIRQLHVLISRKAGDTGVLFGSVTAKDVAEVLEASGINLDRRKILLKQPIKSIGNFTVETRPHNDVEASILVSVLAEGDKPLVRLIPRGEESDRIAEELSARLAEIEKLTGTSQATS